MFTKEEKFIAVCIAIIVILLSWWIISYYNENLKTHRGPLLHEKGFVVTKNYTPESIRQHISLMPISDGNGGTRLSPSIGTETEQERFDVLFKCEHGVVFKINNSRVFAKLKPDDSVEIAYYELINSKGKVMDLDFVDANKK